MGEMVTFPSNGGQAEGYVAVPEAGSGPGVVVIQEWWGLNDQIKEVCDLYAAAGFVALAPDLYRGTVTTEPDEAGPQATWHTPPLQARPVPHAWPTMVVVGLVWPRQ